MDETKQAFAQRLEQLAKEHPKDAARVLAEAVAFLVDRRDIPAVEQWIVAKACR